MNGTWKLMFLAVVFAGWGCAPKAESPKASGSRFVSVPGSLGVWRMLEIRCGEKGSAVATGKDVRRLLIVTPSLIRTESRAPLPEKNYTEIRNYSAYSISGTSGNLVRMEKMEWSQSSRGGYLNFPFLKLDEDVEGGRYGLRRWNDQLIVDHGLSPKHCPADLALYGTYELVR